MNVLWVLAAAAVVLGGGGRLYSRYISKRLGEDPSRTTPAVAKNDGTDYVPTPTPVVFAHHFASIAGAGPILGPALAIIYGWGPALLWVLVGGVFIGAVHDYLATHIATREGGQSIATIARRVIGPGAFVALTVFLILVLALVCASFLNASATALTSMLPFDRLELPKDQTLFRVVGDAGSEKVVIGGIASMSVIIITAVAPVLGWLYLKKKVSVWKCSLLALMICGASITIGLHFPVAFPETVAAFGSWTMTGQHLWMFLLSAYVLIAAGVPVWIFLQSRDFINVHILYVGMALLLVTLAAAGVRGGASPEPLPQYNLSQGREALNVLFWPGLFIFIACGAVSGFHSLCAGGTTCKQITSERAARRIGYNGMLLESFLAVCVIAVLMIGATRSGYISDVHPRLLGLARDGNPVLGFAMAVGNAGSIAFGIPVAVGAVAGMVMLEGFLVTTLDTAIRLTRYLIEEIWRTLFGKYDIWSQRVAREDSRGEWGTGERTPAGADGIPIAPPQSADTSEPAFPTATSGAFRAVLKFLKLYWVNSALAVAIMLVFALSGGVTVLWGVFATSNQLLAAMVLALAALWLLRKGRSFWFALIPAVAMLATTATNLVLLFINFQATGKTTLLVADAILGVITVYLFAAGILAAVRFVRQRKRGEIATE
ncbi:MAG: carbon starvation protein A [Phycisphaerae bacterium]